jgi:NTE family protein
MPFSSEGREAGIALAMSGGGYRAVLFHCGALLRLNELRLLSRLARISSVSGGSIVSGMLAVNWARLNIEADGHISNLEEIIIAPLQKFCSQALDVGAFLRGAINPFKSAGDELVDAYRERLGLGVPLGDLSKEAPRFVFNSTNYATGVTFRFSQAYCGDYRIGLIKRIPWDVATAVAASSAFPPVFAPLVLEPDPALFEPVLGSDLHDQIDFKRKLLLADGGVYDNLGLETVWGRYDTVLVSDGGKPFEIDSKPSGSLAQIARVADIGMTQALALRKRLLIDAFKKATVLRGTYWGIGTLIGNYQLDSAIAVDPDVSTRLSAVRTRLNAFSAQEQAELINWGYAVSDAALRVHLAPLLGQGLPVPKLPHGDVPLVQTHVH